MEPIEAKIKYLYVKENAMLSNILPCKLSVGSVNLANLLIEKHLAEYVDETLIAEPVDILLDEFTDKFDSIVNINTTIREEQTDGSSVSIDFYKEMFERKKLTELIDKVDDVMKHASDEEDIEYAYSTNRALAVNNYNPDFVLDDESIANMDDAEAMTRNWVDQQLSVSIDTYSSSSFRLLDTSTAVSAEGSVVSLANSFSHYSYLSVQEKCFKCEAAFVIDSTHLLVTPVSTSHQNAMEKLSVRIQHAVRQLEVLEKVTSGMPCLARYSDDRQFYRGIVKNILGVDAFQVLFVDYMNEEVVSKKELRGCPSDIQAEPLRNIQVKLSGIKPHRRMREVDVAAEFVKCIENRIILLVVKKNGRVPEVELYTEQNKKILVYEEMIEKGFYVKK